MSDENLEQPNALPYVPTETVYICPAPSELAAPAGWSVRPGHPVEESKTMDRQKAIDELKIAQGNGDTEAAHSSADEVLCRLLSALGYQDVVDEWKKVDKRVQLPRMQLP